MMFNIFSCINWLSVFLLQKHVCSVPLLIFNQLILMFSCMNSLTILDINHLSDMSFANIFSHSVG